MNLDYSPVVDETGKPIGVMAIVVKTTNAMKADRRLRENEARLSFLDALGRCSASILASPAAYADMERDQDGFTIRGDWAVAGAVHIVGHYKLWRHDGRRS